MGVLPRSLQPETARQNVHSGPVISQDSMDLDWRQKKIHCRPVKEDEAALACDLCEKWEHVACIRQCDKLSDALYTALVGCRSKALLYVCSVCRRGGSVAKRFL